MTTTKKIIAASAAIAFAATLSSCEMKKWEEKNEVKTPVVQENVQTSTPTEPEANIPASTESTVNTTTSVEPQQANTSDQNPKMKLFEEKQAKMWKLYEDFSKNNPEVKKLQDQINAIFSSWKQPSEEDMKKVQEIDWKMRALFTPEMKSLDEELRKMWDEIFNQKAPADQWLDNQNWIPSWEPVPAEAWTPVTWK